jgi:hypothetical protein
VIRCMVLIECRFTKRFSLGLSKDSIIAYKLAIFWVYLLWLTCYVRGAALREHDDHSLSLPVGQVNQTDLFNIM